MIAKLTQTYVQNLKPADKLYWVHDTLFKGFLVSVSYGGKKTFYADYRKSNGKRVTRKIGDATRLNVAEAREAAREILAMVERGEDPEADAKTDSKTLTLGEFISDIYGPWVTENRKTGRETILMIQRSFKSLLDDDVTQITHAKLEQWRSQQKKKRNVKASSLNREVTALKAALNWGVTMEMIEASSLSKFKLLKEVDSKKIVRYLSVDERLRLMKALDEREKRMRQERENHNQWLKERGLEKLPPIKGFADHLQPMILVSLNTGIRRNSLFSLEWCDVDFANKMILVRAATSKSSKQYYTAMNQQVFDALLRWYKQSKHTAPHNLVFPSPQTGKKMDNCNTAWGTLMKKADIQSFRWHDMRHDFASQLVMSGVDLNTVRELLGHSDLKMTLRYAHLAPTAKMKAVEILDSKSV